MKGRKSLPTSFSELEDFLDWALSSETLRRQKREASSMEEIREFYDAVLLRAESVFEHFRAAEAEATEADKADAGTKTLFNLMLAFAEASLSIEVHKCPNVPDGMPGDIWKPEHETPGWRKKPRSSLAAPVHSASVGPTHDPTHP